MMKKLGSEYHKTLGQYEKKTVASLTTRQIIFLSLIFTDAMLITLIKVTDIFSLISYYFCLGLLIPIVVFGLNKDELILEKIKFFLSVKDYYYTSDLEREVFLKNDFQKSFQEWEDK